MISAMAQKFFTLPPQLAKSNDVTVKFIPVLVRGVCAEPGMVVVRPVMVLTGIKRDEKPEVTGHSSITPH